MAHLDPSGGNPKQQKKSAPATAAKRQPGRPRKGKPPAAKKPPAGNAPAPTVGRLERTRRLLLAALKVWELKRRIRD